MINPNYPESELTGKIIGCAMEVHKFLGNGFQEVIYQRSLAIEMRRQGLAFSREHEMEIFYKGEQVGLRRVDFFVEGKLWSNLRPSLSWRMFIWRKPSITWRRMG
jgi:GxxExxY protein